MLEGPLITCLKGQLTIKGGFPGQRDDCKASPTFEEVVAAGINGPGWEPSDSFCPFWTPALLRFNQAILVSRHDPASRRRVVEEVRRRATSGGKWPQVGKGLKISPFMCSQRGFSFLSPLQDTPPHSSPLGFYFPQVLFFPEGTCSNKKALLKFKPGE